MTKLFKNLFNHKETHSKAEDALKEVAQGLEHDNIFIKNFLQNLDASVKNKRLREWAVDYINDRFSDADNNIIDKVCFFENAIKGNFNEIDRCAKFYSDVKDCSEVCKTIVQFDKFLFENGFSIRKG